jgi:hypothetical protein
VSTAVRLSNVSLTTGSRTPHNAACAHTSSRRARARIRCTCLCDGMRTHHQLLACVDACQLCVHVCACLVRHQQCALQCFVVEKQQTLGAFIHRRVATRMVRTGTQALTCLSNGDHSAARCCVHSEPSYCLPLHRSCCFHPSSAQSTKTHLLHTLQTHFLLYSYTPNMT